MIAAAVRLPSTHERTPLVTANCGASPVAVSLRNRDGTLGSKMDFSTHPGPSSLAIADVNMDGHPDIVTGNGICTVSVLLGKGNGTFGARTDLHAGFCPHA